MAESQLSELEQRSLAQGETPEVLKRKELEDQLEARKARLGLAEPPVPAVAPPATAPEVAPLPALAVEPVAEPVPEPTPPPSPEIVPETTPLA